MRDPKMRTLEYSGSEVIRKKKMKKWFPLWKALTGQTSKRESLKFTFNEDKCSVGNWRSTSEWVVGKGRIVQILSRLDVGRG